MESRPESVTMPRRVIINRSQTVERGVEYTSQARSIAVCSPALCHHALIDGVGAGAGVVGVRCLLTDARHA